MYTALVLDEKSQARLKETFSDLIPETWEVVAHHMTINMGPLRKGPCDPELLGASQTLKVVSFASNDLVMAVGVESEIPSKNTQKHITLTVNRDGGGKPFFSNKLKEWVLLDEPFELTGAVLEV